MEELFTKNEYADLLQKALWPEESETSYEPAWIDKLKELSLCFLGANRDAAATDGTSASREAAATDVDGITLFFSVFWPHIEESARQRCLEWSVDMDSLFVPGALLACRAGFLEFCTSHWSSTCASAFKEAGYSHFHIDSDKDARQYLFSGKCFHDCCLAYPMFARFLAEYVISTINELSELTRILHTHRDTVYTGLCAKKACDKIACDTIASVPAVPLIASLSGPLSDRHSGGRSVHIVTFADGNKVVYKPRSSKLDIAFATWLDYLTDISGEEPFEKADALDFGTFSFYRFVSPHQFSSIDEVARFFYLEGFLLGAVYILCGRDLHSENIIAARNPVIIDGETLVEVWDERSSVGYSIMSTAMLPLCACRPGYHKEPGGACDTCRGAANLPVMDGRTYSAHDFPDEMIAGFTAVMNTLLGHMPEALETIRRLFTGASTRKLILPSYSYEYTLLALSTPRRMVNASEAAHALSILLKRKAEKDTEVLQKEARIALEREALRRLDIPILHVTLDESAIEKVTSNIAKTTEADLTQQLKYMRFLLDKNSPIRKPYTPISAPTADASGSLSAPFRPDVSTCPDDAVLSLLARETLESFGGTYHIAVPRETGEPCFTLGGHVFLEGTLGAAVALAGYLSCFEGAGDALCEEIRLKLDDYLSNLAQRRSSRKAFSILEPGLAEGMGGMLAGAYLLRRFGMLDEALFSIVAEGILSSTEKALDSGRIFSISHSFLYGFNGLKYALDRIMDLGGLSTDLAGRAENAADRLGMAITYPEASASQMLQAELDEAYLRFDSSAFVQELSLPFPGLFFGTAGKLFRLLGARRRDTETVTPFDFFPHK